MKWPNWHPDQHLTAEDFHAWEDFLLAQGRIAGLAPGLERIDLGCSVRSVGRAIEVTDLAGITLSGMPVEIRPDQNLKVEMSSDQVTEARLVIHVQHLPQQVPKLSLEIVESISECSEHSLYIGKWNKSKSEKWTLSDWPLVRRFEVLGSHPAFDQLAQPVTEFLHKAMGQSNGETTSAALARMSIRRLVYLWTSLDLQEIRRQLLALNWAITDEQSNETITNQQLRERQIILSRRLKQTRTMDRLIELLLDDIPNLERISRPLVQDIDFRMNRTGNNILIEWLQDNVEDLQITVAANGFSSLNLGNGRIVLGSDDAVIENQRVVFDINGEWHTLAMRSTIINFQTELSGDLSAIIQIRGTF